MAARKAAVVDPNRTVQVQGDFQLALDGSEAAKGLFETLSYSCRKEYVEGKKRPSGM